MPTLFALRDDRRPAAGLTPSGRFREPSLFDARVAATAEEPLRVAAILGSLRLPQGAGCAKSSSERLILSAQTCQTSEAVVRLFVVRRLLCRTPCNHPELYDDHHHHCF
jgi:hypothetical protein